MKKLGYWMTEKKLKKLDFHSIFSALCRTKDIELVKIDLLQPLEDQGPFSAILHKLTDVLSLADDGDEKSQEMIDNLKRYTEDHPSVVMLDPVDRVRKLIDRNASYTLFQNAFQNSSVYGKVLVPHFVEIHTKDVTEIQRLLDSAQVKYPFVCKASKAHGSIKSHEMAIIFNDSGLKDIEPPCVAQTFINHNAQMHKIFIIGNDFLVVRRPSIKNFAASDQSTIFFHSHDVSKPNSSSFLNELDKSDQTREPVLPSNEILEELVASVTRSLNLSLFGFDVIVENDTGLHYVIDINAFPGYDGVPQFYDKLLEYVHRVISTPDSNSTVSNHHVNNTKEQTYQDNAPNHLLKEAPREGRCLKRPLPTELDGVVTNGNSQPKKFVAK